MNAPIGTISHDAAAGLLQVTPDQLTRLVGDGTVRRHAPGKYVPAQILRDYIAHLSAAEARFDGLRTQADLAAHLDMSERNLRDVLEVLGLDHKRVPQRDVRVAYIRHLRETAAGRASGSGDGGLDLVQERAALAREQRIRLELVNAATRAEQAPVELLGDALAKAIEVMVAELDQIDGLLAQTAPDLPDAARRAVLACVTSARNKIASRGAQLVLDAIDPDDDIDAGLEDEQP